MGERRVSVITYFFPPLAGIGVQRTLKHVIHLPAAGWRPVVLAPRGAMYRLSDEASVGALPAELEVHRSFCYEPARLRRSLARLLRRSRPAPDPRARRAAGSGPGPAADDRLNRVWGSLVRLFFFPDDQLLWVPFAVRSALHAHRARPSQVLYSSSPPVATHLIAGIVKRRTDLPWVADFRDPWIGNAFAAPVRGFQRRLGVRIERWIVRTADRVVFATEGLADLYRHRYPGRAGRFVVIPNGYDADELAAVVPAPRSDDGTFRLVYTGSIYGEQELSLFLDGLGRALERSPGLRERLRVEFIGWMTDANRALAEAARGPLAPVLEVSGFVPRGEALARLRAADGALLLLADGPGRDLFVGGKLFDYLGLSRQVLAVAPPGDARRVLELLGWGIAADPRPESVADALDRLVATPPPARTADPDGRFERRRLAAQLGALLDEVVAEVATADHS